MKQPISRLAIALLSVTALLFACSTVQVRQDYDQTEDFSQLRTYSWLPKPQEQTGNLRLDNPLLHDRIVAAIDRNLQAKGYTKVADAKPDFYVAYHLASQQKLDVRTIDYGTGYGVWGVAGYGGVGWSETYAVPYEEGTIAIDVIDLARRKLVWRGVGVGRLKESPKPEEVTQRINSAVDEVLVQFPPGQKS
jgi:hypothetical protein